MAVSCVEEVTLYLHGAASFKRKVVWNDGSRCGFEVPSGDFGAVLRSVSFLGPSTAKVKYDAKNETKFGGGFVLLEKAPQELFKKLMGVSLRVEYVEELKETEKEKEKKEKGATSNKQENRTVEGRVMNVEFKGEKHFVTLFTQNGTIVSIPFELIVCASFLENDVRESIERQLLQSKAGLELSNEKQVVIEKGSSTEETTTSIQYLMSYPAWKANHRVVLRDNLVFLETFVVIDNVTQEDWKDVKITIASRKMMINQNPFMQKETVQEPLGPFEKKGNTPENTKVTGFSFSNVQTTEPEFSFELENLISIKAGQSSLVRLFNTQLKGESVVNNTLLLAGVVSCSIYLENNSKRIIPSGPVVILRDKDFIGESLLEALKPEETKLLTFAPENDIVINKKVKKYQKGVHFIRIKDGKIELHRKSFVKTTYSIKNEADRNVVLFLEHPVVEAEGWKLVANEKLVSSTKAKHVFRLSLDSKKSTYFVVQEVQVCKEIIQVHLVHLYQINEWVQESYIDQSVAETLTEICQLTLEYYARRQQVLSIEKGLNEQQLNLINMRHRGGAFQVSSEEQRIQRTKALLANLEQQNLQQEEKWRNLIMTLSYEKALTEQKPQRAQKQLTFSDVLPKDRDAFLRAQNPTHNIPIEQHNQRNSLFPSSQQTNLFAQVNEPNIGSNAGFFGNPLPQTTSTFGSTGSTFGTTSSTVPSSSSLFGAASSAFGSTGSSFGSTGFSFPTSYSLSSDAAYGTSSSSLPSITPSFATQTTSPFGSTGSFGWSSSSVQPSSSFGSTTASSFGSTTASSFGSTNSSLPSTNLSLGLTPSSSLFPSSVFGSTTSSLPSTSAPVGSQANPNAGFSFPTSSESTSIPFASSASTSISSPSPGHSTAPNT